jgi:hypothetical protein
MASFLPEMTILIPLLFTFALVYGLLSILKRTRKMGGGVIEEDFFPKSVNVIIALAFAFATIAYEPFVELIMGMLPIASILLILIFFFVFIKKLVCNDKEDIAPLIAVLGIFLIAVGTFSGNLFEFLNIGYSAASDALWIIGLLVVGVIFYLSWKGGSKST